MKPTAGPAMHCPAPGTCRPVCGGLKVLLSVKPCGPAVSFALHAADPLHKKTRQDLGAILRNPETVATQRAGGLTAPGPMSENPS